MSWTYDETTLATSARNRVRLKLGDTNASNQQLQDEEIDLLLSETGSETAALVAAAQALAAKYAPSVDKWVGDLKILASQRHRAYLDLIEKTLTGTASAASRLAVPTAGGVYAAEKEAMEGDDSLVHPAFRRGLHDNTE